MKLKKLTLKGYKSHKDSTIEFGEKMTFVLGHNGAGKTSLLEAVSIALTGQLPFRAYRKEEFSKLIREDGKGFQIVLEHDQGEIVAEYNGDLRRTGDIPDFDQTSLHLSIMPWKLMELPTKERQRIIAKIAGVDYSKVGPMITAKAAELGGTRRYTVASHEDIVTIVNDLTAKRRDAKRERDKVEVYKNFEEPEGGVPDEAGYQEAIFKIKNWEFTLEAVRTRLSRPMGDGKTAADINAKPLLKAAESAIKDSNKEIEELEREIGMLHSRSNARLGVCPLGLKCPYKEELTLRGDKALKEMDKLQARRREVLDNRTKNLEKEHLLSQILADQEEYGKLQAQLGEIEKLRKDTENRTLVNAQAIRQGVLGRQEYEKLELVIERIDTLIKFIDKEVMPALDVQGKFNELLRKSSPYRIEYDMEQDEFSFLGRGYFSLSASQKTRCLYALSSAIGAAGIVSYDQFEQLDYDGRAKLHSHAHESATQSIILATYSQSGDPGKKMLASTPQRRMYWLTLDEFGCTQIGG